MSRDILLDKILQEIINQSIPPLAVHETATVTYIIYGATTVSSNTGYIVLRITEPIPTHTYTDKGFLLETDRVAGANGSAADVDLKTDQVNTLLLLTNVALIYG